MEIYKYGIQKYFETTYVDDLKETQATPMSKTARKISIKTFIYLK